MTRREQMMECAEAMEQGMIHTQTTRDMWQNDLVWWICKAVKLLLEEGIKADLPNIIRCIDCIHYHPCTAELSDGSAPDWGYCDQPWFNDDQNDVDEMFYCAQGERREDRTNEIHRDNVAADAH